MATSLDPLNLLGNAYDNRFVGVDELLPGAFSKPENNITETVPLPKIEQGVVYDVGKDYGKEGETDLSSSPSWCIAIFRLGTPVTYSRFESKSISSVTVLGGVISRKEAPLIITSECIQMQVSCTKESCTKTLNATLKGDTNYLSANTVLPGDWLMAWMHTNSNDTKRIIKSLQSGAAANDFNSGLKFVGRVHDIRKNLRVDANGAKTVTYNLQGVGFDELSTMFFYDPALATAESLTDIWQFLAHISQDINAWISKVSPSAGQIKDNAEALVVGFLDLIVGKSTSSIINRPGARTGLDSDLKVSPQVSGEAPYAYLVPVSVATTLGRTIVDSKKGDGFSHQAFGYADLLTLLTGVQKYKPVDDEFHHGFVPDNIDFSKSTKGRLRCSDSIKGTYIPIEQCFINTPLWGLLNQFKNPTINEMYTCIRPDVFGDLMPTIVFRQMPFSSNSIQEDSSMPLTRFLGMPRWKIPAALITNLDLGRSNTAHWNFIHVYGNLNLYHPESETSIAAQMLKNPPIADYVDMARSGMKPFMSVVSQSIEDASIPGRGRKWMEAIADWTMGVQFTLNGTVNCFGIQSPIAEGDNIEVDGIALHIDSLTHSCGINGNYKYFNTTLNVTHGMPIDQGEASPIAPRYPGMAPIVFSNDLRQSGDDKVATTYNPGTTVEKG
jgi:hypothetical protein